MLFICEWDATAVLNDAVFFSKVLSDWRATSLTRCNQTSVALSGQITKDVLSLTDVLPLSLDRPVVSGINIASARLKHCVS